ncbi:peptigoglycan-binding protein LysM [Mycolicibacterium duvalii]|uniref:Uncharacterized protein n=1 Tax=Mycolicibacterium duvalii TaxID=39688 RepID=A0A7I7JZH8_9MYCO|nr:peptigoglycan-binding protein LysM [Mycolicibacterium duvalii]MCV7367354.1 peptigoglycan-binding protein LysM [Mycolicibacterium duvalii]PEG43494.1 peptigoglycan-binding protein LysM [Mycolicibacterium duvalii]BBX17276.1 hypothetical protein MDUV_21360 [Mycolicibacterium duvalii]
MTVIYTYEAGRTERRTEHDVPRQRAQARAARPVRVPGSTRPSGSARPRVAPMRYRGAGVSVSRAPHRRRPITPATTVVLALVAAAITVWLGLVAEAGGVVGREAAVPSRLAVVQVQAGESLQHVARRVAPEAPVSEVVAKIRELNALDTVAVGAGQTLIAPIA